VAAESWVLGERAALDTSGPQLRQLERDVITLYTNDYAKQWDAMLGDLNIVPLRNLTQASQDLYIIGSPQSPMRDLLASASKQLAPSIAPPPPPGLAGAAAAATTAATSAASAAQSQLQGLLGNPDSGAPPDPPGFVIDQRYKLLRDFVGTGPGAPIDVVLKLINDLQVQLAHLAATPTGGPAAPPVATGADPAQILRTEALRQPQPVSRWLQDMASSSIALRGGGARQQVADVYNGGGGGAPGAAGGGSGSAASPAGLCKQAVTGRYPFSVGATNEIPMDDFGRLFAPGGLLDGFFNTQLRAYVDMSGTTWKPQPLDGVPAPVAPDQLVQFQRAAVIRDLFFAAGGNAPSVRFDITPTTLDNGARQVTLDLDGLTVSNVHGPTRATQVTWPGTNRMQNVRLIFDPPSSGATGVFTATGPWALFRLFGQGSLVQAGSPELYTLSFRQGDRQAAFEIRAGSVLNPFAPGVLQEFRCPTLP
jgi:type VI secretion system protein ImpL